MINRRGCFKRLAFLSVTLLFVTVGLSLAIVYLQAYLLTVPFRHQNIGSLDDLLHRDITLTTSDGLTISGWYVPGVRPEAIVLVHGIHANRGFLIPQAQVLASAGYHLLMIDLRGHGLSGGDTLTYGYNEALDVLAAVNYLAQQPEVRHIAVLGHSLGGAAAVRAAALDKRIDVLVVQSSFSSLPSAINDSFNNYALLPKWPFEPIIVGLAEALTGIDASQVDSAQNLATMDARPVLIIHTRGDNIFPLHHAETMFQAAREPKALWVVGAAGHFNPIEGHENEYRENLLNFFELAFQ